MAFSNRWVLADGVLNDHPITIRYREDTDPQFTSGDYKQCIQISWSAAHVDEHTGYPAAEELEEIDAFNQKLMAAVESDEQAILLMVLMCQGINQWILYAKDIELLQASLNTIPTDTGLYPIEVVAEEDPSWITFTELRDAIKTH